MANNPDWLGLMIGNSRLHWAWFVGEKLQRAWDTEYIPPDVVQQLANYQTENDFLQKILPSLQARRPLPLYLASVVPSQTALWQAYPHVRTIALDQVPLQGVYATLGIDRALALWGTGVTWGFPALAIDAGTALTFTGADANHCLVGGAILPGVKTQFQSLATKTAELPLVDTPDLPPRWAVNTAQSIQSGVIYTLVAGVKDFITAWLQDFPDSCVTLCGGDRTLLLTYLQSQFPEIAAKVVCDPHLIFWGMRSLRNRC